MRGPVFVCFFDIYMCEMEVEVVVPAKSIF